MLAPISRFCKSALPTLSVWVSRASSSMPRVRIKQGELQGTQESLSSGGSFASFKGIPYAKPPVGDLRYRAPLPAAGWDGVRDASEHGNTCPQMDQVTGAVEDGSEDCLFLNVYTPKVEGPPAPVMVWFHGGGFMSGSGNSDFYGPDHLVEEGVVLVTVNYRLEVLGFLCLETKDFPGNAGMKDQVLALKWVRDNISLFGGDPNNVTIFGESAGGVSATLHMVSPMSKGLFHKYIAQSGCMYMEWARSTKPIDRAFRVTKLLGHDIKDLPELYDFYKKSPAIDLAKVTFATMTKEEKQRGAPIKFCPVIEKPFEGIEPFLLEDPHELFIQNRFTNVPVLIGYNSHEGLVMLRDTLKKADKVNANFETRVPFDIVENVSPEKAKELGLLVKKFYFGDKELSKETALATIDLESDYNFSYAVLNFARNLSHISSCPVYMYKFSGDSELNFMKMAMGLSQYKGASHADDIFYLFKTGMEISEGSDVWRVIKRMARMWANFAKYGNPTPVMDDLIKVKWEPITKSTFNYMSIDMELTLRQDPDKERFDFWNDIYKSLPANAIKNIKSRL